MAQTVVGVFGTHEAAVQAVDELRGEGFHPGQISIFAPDPREAEGYADEVGVRVIQGGATGVAAGGVIGGITGWLVGATGLLVPGAGLFLAAGPIAGALVGLVSGASVGGFLGILAGLGLPRHAAEEYERELTAGRTLVIVHSGDGFATAELAMMRAEPMGVHHYEEDVAGAASGSAAHLMSDQSGDPGRAAQLASLDNSLTPADVSEAIEGQRQLGHTQFLDEPDLRPVTGKTDT